MENLLAEVKKRAVKVLCPDGTSCYCLSFSDEQETAHACACSLKDVQLTALAADILPKRYITNQNTFSNEDQIKLLKSHVAIVGLGGLGGYVVECLARTGIGKLTLIDGDCFDESNLNRQLLCSVETLGMMKAKVAADRIEAINPAIETHVATEFFTTENGTNLLEKADIVIDCLDNISSRFDVKKCATSLGIPMIFAAIGGVTGQVMIFFPQDEGLVKIYGDLEHVASNQGSEASTGTLSFTAMAAAAHECAETVTLLLKHPPKLRHTLLFFDILDHSMEKIQMD